jgi:hypothetical protein
MKSLAVVIGLPFLTIVIVSLFAMGGVGRVASLVLLVASLAGVVLAVLRGRRIPAGDR